MILKNKRHICLFALAVFSGVILYCREGTLWLPITILLVAAICFGLFCGKAGEGERVITGIIVIGLAFTAFLVCRYQDHSYADIQTALGQKSPYEISGRVIQKEIRSDNYVYYLRTDYKKILVYTDSDEIPVGATVTAKGEMQLFSHATNEGQFDFADDYRYQNISCRFYADKMEELSAPCFSIREGLYQFKKRMIATFFAALSEEEAGVMATLTVGGKGLLDSEVKAMYQQAGISHILAISGLHISILGMGLYRFLRKIKCPCHVCEAVGCGVILLFVIMSGMSVSSMRALIMYFVMMGSRTFGRGYDSLNSLAIAALLLLLSHPMSIYRSGFMFSFTAIAAIIIYNDIRARMAWEKKTLKKTGNNSVSENDENTDNKGRTLVYFIN
ncbi:MAG: competence protein ComEC family protein, partial [Clostridiales bacterium]|nr:competence protein ComEC family protein [Clostridiales bacterium]